MRSNWLGRRLLLMCLVLGALFFILAGSTLIPGSINKAVAQSKAVLTLQSQYVERLLQVTFSTMPPASEDGSVTIPDLGTVSWQAGQTPNQFLPLGIFYDSFNLQLLSLEQIAQLSGVDYNNITLADIGLLQDKTLQDLLEAIPEFGQWQIFQVPLLSDLLGEFLNEDPAPWEELPLQKLIEQYGLSDVGLGGIDLSQYGLDAIPGLQQTPLGRFSDWEKTLISEVPGLKDVPFSAFPGIPSDPGFVALFDIAYGKAEARRVNTITGSDVEGFEVPCNEDSCPYIELSGPPWLLAQALHGKQWIVGGTEGQMVRGGHGALAVVNGGMEPTGRHPYGSGFKVVLLETNESLGSGKFGLYFRYCTTLGGCTPYFIGPIPWFTNHEDDIIFVGLNYSAQPPPDVPSHPGLPPGTELPPGVEPLPEPAPSTEPNQNCETYKGVSIPALKQAISTIESRGSGGYQAIGDYVCVRGLCGRALGKYQFMSYKPVASSRILASSGGADFLQRVNVHNNSIEYKQSLAQEILLYFSPAQQEAAFEQHIKNAIDQALQENELGQLGASGAIARVGQIHNAGEGSSPGSSSKYGQKTQEEYEIAQSKIDAECPQTGACEGRFINPAPNYPVTDEFGWSAWRGRPHYGIDIGTPTGTPILAADGGQVIFAGEYKGYGLTVDITHCNGYVTRYAHLNGISVTNGQTVSQGQIIAQSGATGAGTGPHLHFEIRTGQWGTAYEPRKFVTF